MLYRVGRLPDPLAWPARPFVGSGRFDDPKREFRVIYAAAQRRGAFVETLARFRPSIELLSRLRQIRGSASEPVDHANVADAFIPSDWYHRRAVGEIRLAPKQAWLDLRAAQTREVLRRELAAVLLELEMTDLDVSGIVGPSRQPTQAIARWAHERGFSGIVYSSRLDARLSLWAIFEGAAFSAAGVPEPIVGDDPDLRTTARLFGLNVGSAA